MHPSTGKPGVTAGDVAEALSEQVNPLGHARGVLGDTQQTLEQIREHNAVWHTLCDSSAKTGN